MNIKHYILLALMSVSLTAVGQIESKDSVLSVPNSFSIPNSQLNVGPGIFSSYADILIHEMNLNLAMNTSIPNSPADQKEFAIADLSVTPGQARPFSWHNGEVVAEGKIQSFYGLMQIESGTIGISQSFGKFSLYAGAIANKYGYYNGLHTQYGVNGILSYQLAPRLTLTAFGEYYFGQPPYMSNGMPMPPAMAGFYARSNFGGYIDYQINERFGVEAGAQAVQQLGTNRYEAEPIVTPYVKLGKKVKIGLPVGQILYHILRKK